jgi:hypothetical protein
MAKYLHEIDGRQWAEQYKIGAGCYSDDGFLYCRCVAIVNGEGYFNSILSGTKELNGDLEFESMLYVPQMAWAKKHNDEEENYPYQTQTDVESGSNTDLWRK